MKLRSDIIAQFNDKDSDVVICAWNDNRSVLFVSNSPENNPIILANYYDGLKEKKVDVPRPAFNELHNDYKGDVDKVEMYLSLNWSKFRSRKCYHGIVFHLTAFSHCKCFYHLQRKRKKYCLG